MVKYNHLNEYAHGEKQMYYFEQCEPWMEMKDGPDTIIVVLNEKDLEGEYSWPMDCPIARAVGRVTGHKAIVAHGSVFIYTEKTKGFVYLIRGNPLQQRCVGDSKVISLAQQYNIALPIVLDFERKFTD